jgi:hypothetical protein
LEGIKELKAPPRLATHGIFSEAKAARMIEKSRDVIEKRLGRLRSKLQRALADPVQHDPVYQTCQRIFQRDSKLVLGIDSDRRLKRLIRERAMRRFYLGCPPRKQGETSIGDAVNWEWMVYCTQENDAELVILTRDQDYGVMLGEKLYLNDHLKQEFKERVSQKRDVQLFTRASQALKPFHVKVPKEVEQDELAFVSLAPTVVEITESSSHKRDLMELVRHLTDRIAGEVDRPDEFEWMDEDPKSHDSDAKTGDIDGDQRSSPSDKA